MLSSQIFEEDVSVFQGMYDIAGHCTLIVNTHSCAIEDWILVGHMWAIALWLEVQAERQLLCQTWTLNSLPVTNTGKNFYKVTHYNNLLILYE